MGCTEQMCQSTCRFRTHLYFSSTLAAVIRAVASSESLHVRDHQITCAQRPRTFGRICGRAQPRNTALCLNVHEYTTSALSSPPMRPNVLHNTCALPSTASRSTNAYSVLCFSMFERESNDRPMVTKAAAVMQEIFVSEVEHSMMVSMLPQQILSPMLNTLPYNTKIPTCTCDDFNVVTNRGLTPIYSLSVSTRCDV